MLKTEEETAKYTLQDVFIPIMGNEVFLDPKSIAAHIYEKLLFEEEIDMSDFSNHNERCGN